MPQGSRLKVALYHSIHMMDCSTFSQYALLPVMSVIKVAIYHMMCYRTFSQYSVLPKFGHWHGLLYIFIEIRECYDIMLPLND
jgi:Zn-dependent alcohol dehydrogenase